MADTGTTSFIQFLTGELYEILNCFYSITGISVAIYDNMNNEISYCSDVQRPYCALIKLTQAGLSACERLDDASLKEAVRKRQSITYVCHAGLCETIIPIFLQDFHAGFIVMGQYRIKDSDTKGTVKKISEQFKLEYGALCDLYDRVPVITREDLNNYTKILKVIEDGIISEKLIRFSRADMLSTIQSYIINNLGGDLSTASICRNFGVSHSELYKIFKTIGKTPHTYVREQRMRSAYDLIRRSDLSIEEICERINYPNYTYFIRTFREQYGISPGKLRRTNKE